MDARFAPRRPLVATFVALAALVAGCGAAATGPASTAAPGGGASAASFRNDFLAFRYPAGWKPVEFEVTGALHFHPMVYVSTQPSRNPCRSGSAGTVCGWPLDRLRPGGVLIVWENRGYPGWRLASASGTPLRVGGRRAKRVVVRPGECGAIGADMTVRVLIERPVQDNWTSFTACLRGPNLGAAEREIGALLASTRFLAP